MERLTIILQHRFFVWFFQKMLLKINHSRIFLNFCPQYAILPYTCQLSMTIAVVDCICYTTFVEKYRGTSLSNGPYLLISQVILSFTKVGFPPGSSFQKYADPPEQAPNLFTIYPKYHCECKYEISARRFMSLLCGFSFYAFS